MLLISIELSLKAINSRDKKSDRDTTFQDVMVYSKLQWAGLIDYFSVSTRVEPIMHENI